MTTTYTPAEVVEAKEKLLAEANASHAQYAQYGGHWDAWVVARATRDIKQRGALVLRKGELCLLDPTSIHTSEDDGFSRYPGVVFVTVFLANYLSSGCDCSRRASDFEVLGG